MPTRINRDGPDRFSVTDDGLLGASLVCVREREDGDGAPRWYCDLVTDDDRERVFASFEPDVTETAKAMWEIFAGGYYDGLRDAQVMGPQEVDAQLGDAPIKEVLRTGRASVYWVDVPEDEIVAYVYYPESDPLIEGDAYITHEDGKWYVFNYGDYGLFSFIGQRNDCALVERMVDAFCNGGRSQMVYISDPGDGYRLLPDNSGDYWSAFFVIAPDGRTPVAHLNLGDDGKLYVRRASMDDLGITSVHDDVLDKVVIVNLSE